MKQPLIKTIEVALFIVTGLLAMSAQAGVVFTSLYSFTGTNDGEYPEAGLVQGSDGFLYGTTFESSTSGENSNGTVFKISTNGVLSIIHFFTGNNEGIQPEAGLVQASDGYLYGTTFEGATNGGTVFKISTNGVYTNFLFSTYDPAGNAYGNPIGGLIQSSDGNLYGTGGGNVFEMSTNGTITDLYIFGYDVYSAAGLVQACDGYFYGTTAGLGGYPGNIFKINAEGAYTNLYTFNGGVAYFHGSYDGYTPLAGLMQARDGYLYGTTSIGGTNDYGTIFRISTNGVYANLYSFTGGVDGAYPQAGLVQGQDGDLYGTAYFGGHTNLNSGYGYGTVFKVTTSGILTSLYSFTGGKDGADPAAGLVQANDGSFYGTAKVCGMYGLGTVFKLTLPLPPQLSIIADGANAVLTWPADATGYNDAGFILESATNLVPPVTWQTNSTDSIIIGGQDVIINSITGSQQFFRLFSP